MGHFRLNILDSRGGGVFGGFGRGIVEIRGAIGLGKDREIEKTVFSFFHTNEIVNVQEIFRARHCFVATELC